MTFYKSISGLIKRLSKPDKSGHFGAIESVMMVEISGAVLLSPYELLIFNTDNVSKGAMIILYDASLRNYFWRW